MPQWFKDLLPYLPNWISAFFTVVIAVATVFYVRFTRRLWQETKKSADAAEKAAGAAKQSADLSAELQRPFMALQSVTLRSASGENWRTASSWMLYWTIANLGTLPANHVHARLELRSSNTPQVDEGPYDAEVYPQSEPLTRTTHILVNPLMEELRSGKVSAHVVIDYAAPAGSRYKHSAEAEFDWNQGIFSLTKLKTEVVEAQITEKK